MKIYCTHCNQKYDVEAESLGTNYECQICHKEFIMQESSDNPTTANLDVSLLADEPESRQTNLDLLSDEPKPKTKPANLDLLADEPEVKKTAVSQVKTQKKTKTNSRKPTKIKASKKRTRRSAKAKHSSMAPILLLLIVGITGGVYYKFGNEPTRKALSDQVMTETGSESYTNDSEPSSLRNSAQAEKPTNSSQAPGTYTVGSSVRTEHPFIGKYCLDCHNDEKMEGDLSLLKLTPRNMDLTTYEHFQDMLTSVKEAEMPPKKAKRDPSELERNEFMRWLEGQMLANKARLYNERPQTVLRRLNAYEYSRTLTDLFRLNTEHMKQLTTFPEDQKKGHFTNNGEALLISSYQLSAYARTASEVFDMLQSNENRSEVTKFDYDAPFITNKSWRGFLHPGAPNEQRPRIWSNGFERGQYQDIHLSAPISIEKLRFGSDLKGNTPSGIGVPSRGYYKVTFELQALNRTPAALPKDKQLYWSPEGELSLQLLVDGVNRKEWKLPDTKSVTLSEYIWLEKGSGFEFRFPQGLGKFTAMHFNPLENIVGKPTFGKYMTEKVATVKKGKKGKKGRSTGPYVDPKGDLRDWVDFYSEHYPTLRFTDITLEGPLHPPSIKRAHEHFFANSDIDSSQPVDIIKNLLYRAFRGYGNSGNMKVILDQVEKVQASSGKAAAIKAGIAAALTSPWFIYMVEEADEEGNLTAVSLANRLSYFLWGSMPDMTLMKKARDGSLLQAEVLRKEFLRMLKSSKRKGLVKRLAGEWVALDTLGEMRPSRGEYSQYYSLDLEKNSRLETEAFLDHLISRNRPLNDLIDSDYTFVNRALAIFYQLEHPEKYAEDKMAKIEISDPNRGGLLGQAAVLIATADGAMTNPVMRGLWVLRTLLGEDVSDPPEAAEPIEVDLRGGKSKPLRAQLEAHSKITGCKACHDKFDHLGYGLQNFDVIGRYRTHFVQKKKSRVVRKSLIDGSARMPNGETYRNISEMKKILLKNQDDLARGLIRTMLTLSCGREMNITDEETMNELLLKVKKGKYKFAHLISEVVLSDTFRKK